VFAVLFAILVTLVVVLGALPGRIAARRGHPQAKAVAAAGWISLITLFAIWPIAFIWAFVQPRSAEAFVVPSPISAAGTFIDTSDTFVVASFPAQDLIYVQPGQEVELAFTSRPGQTIRGKVETI